MHRLFVSGLFTIGLLFAFAPLYSQDYGGGALIAGAGFSKNKIQYRDFKWEIYHSPHFNLYYYQEEKPQLQKVVSFAESAYDKLSREFNFQIKDPVPLIFYATHSAFEQNNVLLNFIPEGVGAFASPARYRMVLPIDVPDPELMQLISHELTHIFQYHMLFQGSLAKAVASGPPTWFMEGMASYMAKDESQRDRMYLRDAVVNDRIPSVARGSVEGFFAYRFGAGRASSTSSSRCATPSARGWTRPSSGPSRSSRRTSISSSAAGCARSTCRSSCRRASLPTSAISSASTRTARATPLRSRRWPRRQATWWPLSRATRARWTSCCSTPRTGA